MYQQSLYISPNARRGNLLEIEIKHPPLLASKAPIKWPGVIAARTLQNPLVLDIVEIKPLYIFY